MSTPVAASQNPILAAEQAIPSIPRAVLRGVGQVFFQENALSGTCFLIGIALGSPLMALGALGGSAIGYLIARLLNFDRAEADGGIFGFNSALVGIASFFFFQPGPASIGLMLAGCVAAAILTFLMRRFVPFPTYTAPFILITWVIYFLAPSLGAVATASGGPPTLGALEAIASGVGQVMFQAGIAVGALFLLGIALGDWRHAVLVIGGSVVGMLLGGYHATAASRTLDPERLIERALTENISLGLYGYNATLAAVALFLWRRSLVKPLLGAILAVLLTEVFPLIGLPALTAPFVLATWLVLALAWTEHRAVVDVSSIDESAGAKPSRERRPKRRRK